RGRRAPLDARDGDDPGNGKLVKAGGDARLLYTAWRYGGHDPYRLYNSLSDTYVPFGGGPPKLPPYPSRVRAVILGFAQVAAEEDAKRGGGGTATPCVSV